MQHNLAPTALDISKYPNIHSLVLMLFQGQWPDPYIGHLVPADLQAIEDQLATVPYGQVVAYMLEEDIANVPESLRPVHLLLIELELM